MVNSRRITQMIAIMSVQLMPAVLHIFYLVRKWISMKQTKLLTKPHNLIALLARYRYRSDLNSFDFCSWGRGGWQ